MEGRLLEIERLLHQIAVRLSLLETRVAQSEQARWGGTGMTLGYTPGSVIHFKSPGGGIPARSGTTLGSATCDHYTRTGTTLASSGRAVTIYNDSTTAFTGNIYGVAGQDDAYGWVAIVESCT